MRFTERIKREIKELATGGGHAMSAYRKTGAGVNTVRSDCGNCGGYIELDFTPPGRNSFAPVGRAPFEKCRRASRARVASAKGKGQ